VCYVGQVIFDADRVEAEFADSGTVEAAVLAGDLPVKLWVAFADVGNPLAAVRACRDRRELAAIPGVGEHRQRTHSSAVWGPIDE
jgi:S1-C subfamily serine protease